MATLPRQCNHCKRNVYHYGDCTCLDARLEVIDAEREQISRRLSQLDDMEREILGLRPNPPIAPVDAVSTGKET